MSDLISRQAAIDALDVLCQEHRYKIPGKRKTYSEYNEAWQDALDRAESAIGNLPPAQPEAPCYLGSPCEYQNPNAEIQEERTETHAETHASDLIRRKTGVWLAYTSVPGYMFCKCAACGADILVPYTGRNKPIFNYCPNCGAKMKGEMI